MKLYEGTLVQAAKLNVDLRRPPQHRIVCPGLDLQQDQKYQMLNVFSGTCLTVLEITKRPAGCFSLQKKLLSKN